MPDLFHPVIREWFDRRFGSPTEAQAAGWPAIAANRNALIVAPTGSGKTLTAFLLCLDHLLKSAMRGELTDAARVVYVSPLKALSNDIHRNLDVPLKEILTLAREKGLLAQDIRVALRTGDTPARERHVLARKPPHIWVTTPESFYILLTSESGRRGLAGVNTVILDEIHAVAGNKRGAHLAVSVERLARLTGKPLQRIGLSATLRPLEEIARFLVGTAHITETGEPRCAIVDTGHRRDMDLRLELPDMELGAVASRELWEETVSRIAKLAGEHETTLVFVNTRRLAERVAHQLSDKLGEEHVAAHHGSLSFKTRMEIEDRLQKGEIRVCVATASLELGIDVGAVDLVCQIGSPRSIGVLLQRVGRSGHQRGGLPKGRIFPLTRDELIECAALIAAVRAGELDRVSVPAWPLDVLSQQIVAMCAAEDWKTDALFETIRNAYSYRDLPKNRFDAVIEMLSEGFAPKMGRGGAYLRHDAVNQIARARRGARLTAVTCGGAIPDTADYDVVTETEGTRVGSVNEEFAFESMIGDVFLLGNTSWRIRRVSQGKVLVEDAHGQAPDVPFWRGEAPSRTDELSRFVSIIRRGIDCRCADPEETRRWLEAEAGISPEAAEQTRAYIAEGKRVLGMTPSDTHVAAERFFDETGGMQLVLHAPFGARINKAWGLTLRRRFAVRFGLDTQTSATDDGVNLSLTPQHAFSLKDFFDFITTKNLEETLTEAVMSSSMFLTRWRWTLTRSLALRRFAGGKKVPAPLQRMRADDLLAAILPQSAVIDQKSFDNPLVFETLRDCLHEAMNATGLRDMLEKIHREEILFSAMDSALPSAFSHQILNAMPYAFLDNAPLQERRARAVTLRRALPDDAGDMGRLDPEAVRAATENAWPTVRDAEELHDALFGWILFPEALSKRLPPNAADWMESLAQSGRAARIERNGVRYWSAAEKLPPLYQPDDADMLLSLTRGWVETIGPFAAEELSEMLAFPRDDIFSALDRLEKEGFILRGFFSERGIEEFCDRRILARIHRDTLARLRRECAPVSPAAFLRFLFQWQHLAPDAGLSGEAGVFDIIRQLQGFEAAASAWESDILPSRIKAYQPEFLDSLCANGDVVWGRWKRRETGAEIPTRRPGLTRIAPIGLCLRDDLAWLLDDAPADENAEAALSAQAREILAFLGRRGASFFQEIMSGVHRLPSEAEEALWQLVAAGWVTADAFAALRALVSGETKRVTRPSRRRLRPVRRTREGRWSLLAAEEGAAQNRTKLWAYQLLNRYGVFCRELLAREPAAPQWRFLLPALRRMEARGEIRGGRFITGMYGEQFALPDAVDAMRAARNTEPERKLMRISACDPLNLAGILTPGQRVAAVPGNRIVYMDCAPVAAIETGKSRFMINPDSLSAREKSLITRSLEDERRMGKFQE